MLTAQINTVLLLFLYHCVTYSLFSSHVFGTTLYSCTMNSTKPTKIILILIKATASSQHKCIEHLKQSNHQSTAVCLSLLTYALFVFRKRDRKRWRQCASCKTVTWFAVREARHENKQFSFLCRVSSLLEITDTQVKILDFQLNSKSVEKKKSMWIVCMIRTKNILLKCMCSSGHASFYKFS